MKCTIWISAFLSLFVLCSCSNPASSPPAPEEELPPSTDATLKALSLSQGSLSPGFAPDTMFYSASVPDAPGSITITPSANESHAVITVNGTSVASGSASSAIPLVVGLTTITIEVTAQAGQVKDYSVDVTRLESGSIQFVIATPQDLAVELSGQTEHLQKPNSMSVSTTFTGATSYRWTLDGVTLGTSSSVVVSSSSMDVGGPYVLALIVTKDGQTWSGSVAFMVEN